MPIRRSWRGGTRPQFSTRRELLAVAIQQLKSHPGLRTGIIIKSSQLARSPETMKANFDKFQSFPGTVVRSFELIKREKMKLPAGDLAVYPSRATPFYFAGSFLSLMREMRCLRCGSGETSLPRCFQKDSYSKEYSPVFPVKRTD